MSKMMRLWWTSTPESDNMRAMVDGIETRFTLTHSRAGSYEYTTLDGRSAHSFPFQPTAGQAFRLNGHQYKILKGDSQ